MRRERFINVRCSDVEHEALAERAFAAGLPVSTYLRTVALGVVPKERITVHTKQAIHALNRLGNNLNQLARRHNSNEPVARSEAVQLFEEIRQVVRRLVR